VFDKPKRRTRSTWAEALSLVVASAVTITLGSYAQGCSRQGEGERCSRLAGGDGDDDCEEGLICKSGDELGGGSDICCPPEGSTNPACIPNALTGGGGAGTGGEGGSTSSTGGGEAGAGGTGGTAGGGGQGGQGGAAGGGGAPGGNGGMAGQGGTGG